jgi:hypothetical protein
VTTTKQWKAGEAPPVLENGMVLKSECGNGMTICIEPGQEKWNCRAIRTDGRVFSWSRHINQFALAEDFPPAPPPPKEEPKDRVVKIWDLKYWEWLCICDPNDERSRLRLTHDEAHKLKREYIDRGTAAKVFRLVKGGK